MAAMMKMVDWRERRYRRRHQRQVWQCLSLCLRHVSDAVVRRQNTSRARVHVVEPLAAKHPWSRVCSSNASVESCQTTGKAALGA